MSRSMNSAALILILSAACAILIYLNWEADSCLRLEAAISYVNHNFIVLSIVLLLWSFFLFLTVLPLGTVTVVTAGYVLGPIAGAIQFVSLVAASIILYELAKDKDNRLFDDRLGEYPRLMNLINTMRHRGIVFVVLSRLLPMIPSAIASLSASYVGISRRDYMVGLFLAGWVRPILFGMLGALGRTAPICPGFSGI